MGKIVFFLLTLAVCFNANAACENYDVIGVRTLLADFVKAWNTHDSQNMVTFWATDGDIVNPNGRWGKGQNNIERILRDEQTSEIKKTTMEQTIDSIRFFQPDLVFVDATSTISGDAATMEGKPFFLEYHTVYLLQKKENVWKIVSARPYILQGKLTKVK